MDTIPRESFKAIAFPRRLWPRILLAGIVALSFGLNLFVPPEAPIHSNTHGIETIRTILQPRSEINQKQFYGTAYIKLMRVVCSTFGRTETTIYNTNALLGALAVWALFFLARAVGIGFFGALFSAFLLAVQPAYVWLAGSEFPATLYQLLAFSGLGMATFAASHGRGGLLWPAALLLAMACRLHALTILLLPVAAGFVVFGIRRWRGTSREAFWLHLAASSVCCVALWAAHVRDLWWTFGAFAGHSDNSKMLVGLTRGNILLDPTLTPLAVVPLAIWAAVVLARRHRPMALLLGWTFLLVYPAGLLVNSYRTDAVRYQTPTHWVLFLAVGGLIAWSPWWKRVGRHRAVALSVVLALVVGNAAYGLYVVGGGSIETREYRFMRNTLAQMEDSEEIHLPPLDDPDRHLLVDFPLYRGRHRLALPPRKPGLGDLVYLGLNCYRDPGTFEERMGLDGMREECKEVCPVGEAEPVEVRTLRRNPTRPGYHIISHGLSTPTPEVGFYRCVLDGE